MTALLRRSTLWVYNQSSVPTLVKSIQKGHAATEALRSSALRAQTFMDYASKHCPAIFKPHAVELAKALGDSHNAQLVATALRGLAAIVQQDHTLAPTDK